MSGSSLEIIPRTLVHLASPVVTVYDHFSNNLSAIFNGALSIVGGPRALPPHPPSSTRPQCVLVTGSNSGIGRETALRLARAGYIVFGGVRKTEHGDDLIGEFKQEGGNGKGEIVPVIMDVTILSDVKAALETITRIVRARAGELVAVVNVAGVILLAPYETASDEELRAQFDVNFFAVLTVSRTFLPLLKESKGRLINIGSAASFIVAPSAGIYSATKAAVAAATDALRMEIRSEGVGVSLIEPGCIRTRAWEVGIARLHAYNSTPNLPASGITTDHPFSTKSGVSREKYETLFSRLESIYRLAITLAFPPRHIAQHVEHAIRSRFPRSRYLGGPDVKVADFVMRFVPSGVVAAAFGWVLWSQG